MIIVCRGLWKNDLTVECDNGSVSLGCDPSENIVVSADGVAPHHVILNVKNNHLFIQDAGSPDGTFINDCLLDGEDRLRQGDNVRMGTQVFHVAFSNDRTNAFLTFDLCNDAGSAPENGTSDTTNTSSPAANETSNTASSDNAENLEVTLPMAGSPRKTNSASSKMIFSEGQEVGKYVVLKRIGKGGMGEIYLARHKTLGVLRAIKVLPKEMQQDDAKFFDRFVREAKLASEIKHPNVVGVMDVEFDEQVGFSYIVMEYIDGGSLRHVLKIAKRLSEEQSVIIVEGVAAALIAAEEKKIVHRDIKPDNIMFTQRGEVKLADLGIAKNDEDDTELTRTNVMIGTPAYLPPEQVQNAKGVDCRADIYSLGATFYEMLTGQQPYPAKNTYDIIHKLFYDPVPDPRKLNPDISEASAKIAMKMMAKKPEERYQNAAELLQIFEETFPRHTSKESSDEIKKAVAGDNSGNPDFATGMARTKKAALLKKYALFALVGSLLIVGGICWYAVSLLKEQTAAAPEPEVPASFRAVPGCTLTVKTVPGAEVRIIAADGAYQRYSVRDKGVLKIKKLKTGVYTLKFSCKNYIDSSKEVDVEADTAVDEMMKLDLKKLLIQTEPGARITIRYESGNVRKWNVPGTGDLEIPDLLPENVTLIAEKGGFEPFSRSMNLKEEQAVKIQLQRLKRTLTLKTIPFAEVTLSQKKKVVYSSSSDALGVCTIGNIEYGFYEVKIVHPECFRMEFGCDLTRNQSLVKNPVRITYNIELISDPGAQIRLLKDNQLAGTYFVPENGSLMLSAVAKGKYTILVEKSGSPAARFTLDADNNKTVEFLMKNSRSSNVSLSEIALDGRSLAEKIKWNMDEDTSSENASCIAGKKALNEKKYQDALELFMAASNEGDPEAMFQMARIYDSGLGLSSPDRKRAGIFYRKAAGKKHKFAACRAAALILDGTLSDSDETMIRLFTTAADQQHPVAEFLLGVFFENGIFGVEKNQQTALFYYTAAAELGYPDAMWAAARMLEAKNDMENAVVWYEKAADAGVAEAKERIDKLTAQENDAQNPAAQKTGKEKK